MRRRRRRSRAAVPGPCRRRRCGSRGRDPLPPRRWRERHRRHRGHAGSRRASSARSAASRARAWPSRSTRRAASVIIWTATSPARSRPSQAGTRSGGLAPTASAMKGRYSETGAGSSSTMLKMPVRLMFEGDDRRRGRVVDMRRRPDPGATADDRQLPRTEELDDRIGGTGSVEVAVAQDDALERGGEHRLLDDTGSRPASRSAPGGMGIQGILLGLDRAAVAAVVPARIALGDEPPRAGGLRRGEEVLGAGGPQLVGRREPAIEVLEVGRPREGTHLVNDRLRLRSGDGLADTGGIEPVDHDGVAPMARTSSIVAAFLVDPVTS